MVADTHEGLAVTKAMTKGYAWSHCSTSEMKWKALDEGGTAVGRSAMEAARRTQGANASRKAAVCS